MIFWIFTHSWAKAFYTHTLLLNRSLLAYVCLLLDMTKIEFSWAKAFYTHILLLNQKIFRLKQTESKKKQFS